jgi:hypothetical protein
MLEQPMSQPVPVASAAEMTRVTKVRVQVRADSFLYEGTIHLLAEVRRIQEVLNDPKPFLNLTEVVIHDRAAASTSHAPYVALNKGAISHVIVLSGDRTGAAAEAPAPEAPPRSAVAQPTIPPAGPRTMPAPTRRARNPQDPPTQPFPRGQVAAAATGEQDDEDVSDLILDDDGGDDIDPSDLVRDGGAPHGAKG